jgi:hypothetical protein
MYLLPVSVSLSLSLSLSSIFSARVRMTLPRNALCVVGGEVVTGGVDTQLGVYAIADFTAQVPRRISPFPHRPLLHFAAKGLLSFFCLAFSCSPAHRAAGHVSPRAQARDLAPRSRCVRAIRLEHMHAPPRTRIHTHTHTLSLSLSFLTHSLSLSASHGTRTGRFV